MPIIEELYAFCSKDNPGDEGIIAVNFDGRWQPLIGADMERVESLRDTAIGIGEESSYSVVLKRFKLVSEEVVYTAKPI